MSLSSSNPLIDLQQAPQKPHRSLWYRTGLTIGIVAWTFLGFMLAQAIGLAILAGLQAAGVSLEDANATTLSTVTNIFVYCLAIAIIIGVPYLVKKRGTTLKDIGLDRLPRWKDFLWLLAGLVAYIILTLIVTSISMALFPQADYNEAQNTGFSGLANQFEFVLAFISLVIVAPVAEEVIFRGYLFGKLRKNAQVWISVLLTSALFAIAHFQFNVALDTFALGVVLALLRVASGSIWASILLHMLKNGIAFYFLFVNPGIL